MVVGDLVFEANVKHLINKFIVAVRKIFNNTEIYRKDNCLANCSI